MYLPVTDQQCFFIVLLAFVIVGLMRGWRRELVSLVFVLLAVFFIRANTSASFADVLNRIPAMLGYLFGGPQVGQAGGSPAPGVAAPFWSLIIFAAIVALGYYVGNKAFPKPTAPHERFIGIVPAVITGAFVMGYLSNYFVQQNGQPRLTVAVPAPDPTNYVPIILVVAIVSVVVALIASRAKKSAAAKK
ncbi:MAG TPA: hypothetical protein VH593_25455 [Ktedonobacteraceae bacterium]|jgi:hypothetical protein